jgi:3-oxoacyl-[acyl-carrier protein] reductase
MDLGLQNKVILITGATGGIGYSAVQKFIKEGAKVVAHFFQNDDKAKEMRDKWKANLYTVKADLAQELHVVEMFQEILGKWGKIDVLVNNAGIWPNEDQNIFEMSASRWKKTLATNLDSAFYCCREFLKQLKTNSCDYGNIVNIGSTAALFGEAGHIDYSSSKSALTYGFTLSLKNEIVKVAKFGRVNAICPGWVNTPMSADALEDVDGVHRVLQTVPLRKIATPEDIANQILILASDKVSGHITGEKVTIAGGMEGRVLFTKDEIDFKAQ